MQPVHVADELENVMLRTETYFANENELRT